MSEHTLWTRLRENIGHHGHFTRLEFNPEAGIPDVDYCVKGGEGKIELKYIDRAPVRVDTAVFHTGGLRDAQVIWIHTRVRHGGRVFVLPQVGGELLLIPGSYARTFNAMTLHQLEKASIWAAGGSGINVADWRRLSACLGKYVA